MRALGYDYAAAAVAAGTDVPPGAARRPDTSEVTESAPIEPTPPTTAPKYTSETLNVGTLDRTSYRVDIEFHASTMRARRTRGASTSTTRTPTRTPATTTQTYAGSYHIFGHGGCLGDPGHCDVEPRRRYDPRPAHPLTPAKKVVIATDPVKRAIEAGRRGDRHRRADRRAAAHTRTSTRSTPRTRSKIGYVRVVAYR